MASSSQVRVGVRIRPLTPQESCQGGKQVVEAIPPTVGIGKRRFTYDAVFDSQVSQSDLYGSVSGPLLRSFLDGYNATIMAYGQTGSGKTFTMGSEAHLDGELVAHPGLIPRFMSDIFEHLQRRKKDSDTGDVDAVLLDYHVSASFLEVYGEDVHDLLDEERKTLPLREDSNGGVVVAGLTSRAVAGAEQALQVLHEGTRNRTTASTLMNLTSSRSHAVFTISLQQTCRGGGQVDVTTTSRFTFVDLAGSERMKKTGAEGERAREGIKINEGLLALGNVINALADEERLAKEKKIHVPYRQSKLTRLLQDALGGNSQTLFLACVSPADTNASETLSTLHYANRARNIKNAPTKNVDATVMELQRLHSLTSVLQSELVKHRFGKENAGEESTMGEVDETLLSRPDVMEYLDSIHNIAEERRGSSTSTLQLTAASTSTNAPPVNVLSSSLKTPSMPSGRPRVFSDHTDKSTHVDRFDDSFLEEVNPEQDMAILDQLLELQHRDSEYDKEHKKDQEELKLVQGELEEQEGMLLQLRDSLKVYHNLKQKYELLMTEVQQLETEKSTLADQLEKAKVDPSKGCSLAIKKKLEKVEKNLARARTETKRHQQMCRKAEQQAKNCKALEVKIGQLKQGKVALMKKQKQAALRHREYTETKTREMLSLKRKERTNDKLVSKLETEILIHKKNLGKRKVYCDKLTGKLKQTESHLMKLLAMRKRELHHRTSAPISNRRTATHLSSTSTEVGSRRTMSRSSTFATKSEDLDSSRFLLEKVIADHVSVAQLKVKYEDKVADYGELMRSLVSEVESLNEAKEKVSDEYQLTDELAELEQNVEDLELKLELVGSELDDLRMKLPNGNDVVESEGLALSDHSKQILSGLSPPVLRTLLVEMTEKRASIELECQRQAQSTERKESALQSFELEMAGLNRTVRALNDELTQRRALGQNGNDAFAQLKELEEQEAALRRDLEATREEHAWMKQEYDLATKEMEIAKIAKAELSEKLALAESIVRQHTDKHEAEGTLSKLQTLWMEIGVNSDERAEVERQVRSCLEDTCSRKLQEATALREKTVEDIDFLGKEIGSMLHALGKPTGDMDVDDDQDTLLGKLRALQERADRIRPEFESAVLRRAKLVADVERLTQSLDSGSYSFSDRLSKMVEHHKRYGARCARSDPSVLEPTDRPQRAEMMKAVADMLASLDDLAPPEGNSAEDGDPDFGPADSLKSSFLDEVEREIVKLRLFKSEKLARNAKCRDDTNDLVAKMHLSATEIVELVVRSVHPLPDWWSTEQADEAASAVADSDSILKASELFTKHLDFVHGSVTSVANERQGLSEALKGVVDRAQKTLLMTVDGELDVSEAYASFHSALFQLPPLSEEHIQACITELNALVTGVEAMTQSEVEALTVVWEALSISSSDRGQFWATLEEAIQALQAQSDSPFDSVISMDSRQVESWFRAAVGDAKKVYRLLDVRLYKLEQVHKEVERLRSKQDMKSQILSLDSEIRILSAKLADFEEKKCDKNRLLSKKTGSAALLKEERFRKQMQGKFTAKLEQLSRLLQSWIEAEGSSFDGSLLSEEVRMLLQSSPDKMTSWVEKRTEFMHLRTVQAKPAAKRGPISKSSSRKRSGDSLKSTSSSEQTTDDGTIRPKKKAARPAPVGSERDGRQRRTTKSNTRAAQAKRKASSASNSPVKPKNRPTRKGEPLSPNRRDGRNNNSSSPNSKKPAAKRSKRESKALLPFGNLLDERMSPQKENADN